MNAPAKFPIAQSGLKLWWIAVAVMLADQLSKYLVVSTMELRQTIVVLPVLNIYRTFNLGAAWSFGENFGGAQVYAFSALAIVVSCALVYWLRKLAMATHTLLATGIALILGGAIGNVIDRLRLGHVVDFIQVHWGNAFFPTFNVADSAISVGAVLVLLDAFFESQRERASRQKQAQQGEGS